ncbi:SIR2 family protein [Clostridium ganghwense]|uniref:SIR2 family protein n=1 Tax=Clostridium ganghwense TaxID=312089 RepID=A0ABT4CM17_9CLOT|nr:SIR2 family protein [Clostridium ganghwense]MCY6369508.1 SIR2 family protein [Clostridium ganghwense]
MDIPKELIEEIKEERVILFVGAGISENLGLAPWETLIDEMARELSYNKDVFKSMGNFLELAEFYKLRKKSIGPLRSWMDINWHNSNIKIEQSKIHKLIIDLNFPIIYTTNYDRWIENAFDYYNKKYVKIVRIDDLVNIKNGVTQIIKFHGDLQDEPSIVLTESSYFERLSFETPLDIKLRGDILGKSILFIGYSLSDINIRYLLFKLNKLWAQSKVEKCRPKSYIFLLNKNLIQQEILESRGIKTIIADSKDKGNGVEEFLRILSEKIITGNI